jgi:hypothetical protein
VNLFSRKSSARAIEELQRTLVEVETRYKTEITRIKKKYETDIRELEAALDNANRANAEYLKQIKSLQHRVKVRILNKSSVLFVYNVGVFPQEISHEIVFLSYSFATRAE